MKPGYRTKWGRRTLICAGVLWVLAFTLAGTLRASQPPNTACPQDFFTNVASRLLASEMNVDLDHIQIYPANEYTPAIHRLLQVTANILDATTTNYYPSVFRPLFWKTNQLNGSGIFQTNVYIAGYQYVQEPLTNGGPPIFALPTDASDPSIPFGLSGISNNIYGVPWVIGVKKGLPNFNAVELDNCFFIERQLQFNRNNAEAEPAATPFPFGRIYTTNEMYVIGLSNLLGVEFWNSYTANYSMPVTVVARDTLSVGLTNDAGFSVVNNLYTNAFCESNSWPGASSASSFVLPLGTNEVVAQDLSTPGAASADGRYVYYYSPNPVTLSGYTFEGPCFIPAALDPSNFLDAGTPPLPHFGLLVTNRLQAYIIDTNNCILDYVQLCGMNSGLDVNAAIADPDNMGLWSTNFYADGTTPFGVNEQFLVSAGGAYPAEDEDGGIWSTAQIPGTTDTGPTAQMAFFLAFFSSGDVAPYGAGLITNTYLSMLAPFTPSRLIVQRMVFAANDPLVHYLASDLDDRLDDTNAITSQLVPTTTKYMGRRSDRYLPWGTEGNLANPLVDNNPYNPAYKDPLVSSPDKWSFPTNETLEASWLGQIHRGTPWQTIFLKSTNILDLTETVGGQIFPSGSNTWELWTGDTNAADAVSMAPVRDWDMASLLASLFNTNNIASLFSVNDENSSDWRNLIDGTPVLTNDLPDAAIQLGLIPAQFAVLSISSNSPQAALISSAIESVRAAAPGGLMVNVGDIFETPQLSDESPYLNVDPAQTEHGISDAAYEAIPSQLLPLLWEDAVGAVSLGAGQVVVQFTGDDNHAYALQVSSDLRTWKTVGTNCTANGVFTFTNVATSSSQFYRTVLVQ